MKRALAKISELWSTSLLFRVSIGAIAGAIGSSTIIGFIAEYGAINYALAYGVRLPTEGVPYLRYAATVLSLSVLLAALLAFLIVGMILRSALVQLNTWSAFREEDGGTRIADLPLKKYLLYGVLPAAAATQGFFSIIYVMIPVGDIPSWITWAILIVLTALILLLGRKPTLLNPVIALWYIGLVGAFFVTSFVPSYYANALSFAGQGGGLPISIIVEASGATENIDGHLFLRTKEFVVLRDSSSGAIREIPIDRVLRYQYVGNQRW